MLSALMQHCYCSSSPAATVTTNCKLTVRLCMGGLSARPVETLLISRRVSAGKFCTCMTLLSYLLSVQWRKYQYTKLINEFLANFLLYLPYRKCCLNADLTHPTAAAEAATGLWDIDKEPQREANECMRSAPRNRQPVLVGVCLYAPEISVDRLQNYLASEHVCVAETWPARCEPAV